MKKIRRLLSFYSYLTLILCISNSFSFGQSTVITGGSTGNMQFPTLSYEQILSIPLPKQGASAYDSTFNCLRIYNGNCWLCSFQNPNEIAPIGKIWKLGGTSNK